MKLRDVQRAVSSFDKGVEEGFTETLFGALIFFGMFYRTGYGKVQVGPGCERVGQEPCGPFYYSFVCSYETIKLSKPSRTTGYCWLRTAISLLLPNPLWMRWKPFPNWCTRNCGILTDTGSAAIVYVQLRDRDKAFWRL